MSNFTFGNVMIITKQGSRDSCLAQPDFTFSALRGAA